MYRTNGNRVGFITAAASLVVAGLAAVAGVAAQDVSPAPGRPVGQTEKDNAARVAPGPVRGRLPAYYGQVVTEEQRQRIYAIQTKHRLRIQTLEAELKALRAEQRQQVEAVLSPEQHSRVADLRLKARESRSQKATSSSEPTTTD